MSGLSDELTGKAKQAVGDVKGDDKLKAEGKGQELLGDLKQKATEAIDKVGDKVEELKKKDDK